MTEKKKTKSFDISNYQIQASTEVQTVTIPETGDEFNVTVKPLSWSKRNQLISKCIIFDGKGGTSFDGDIYVKESLKEMLIDAPWGRTTESFLSSIDSRLGTALENIVPKAFAGENNTGEESNKIKKE